MGVKAEKSIMIGDSFKSDILGATSVGIDAILINRFENDKDYDCQKIKTLDEINIL